VHVVMNDESLDVLFRTARSYSAWLNNPSPTSCCDDSTTS